MSFFANNAGWPLKPLKDVAHLKRGYDLPTQERVEGDIPIFAANGKNGTHNEAKIEGPGVVTGRSGTIGKVHFTEHDYWPLNTALYVTDFKGNDPKWVYYMLQAFKLERFVEGAGVPTLNRNLVHDELIPLPPLAEQKRIAAILDKADAIRRKRQQAIQLADDFLRAVFLEMFGDPVTNPKNLRVVPLADLCNKITDGTHQSPRWENSGVPFLFISNIANGKINYATNKFISKDTFAELTRTTPIEKDDILYTTVGSYGNVALVPGDKEFCFQRHIAHIKPNHQKIKPMFLAGMLESSVIKRQADALVRGVAQKTLNLRELKEIRVFDILENEQQKYLNIITPVRRTKDNFERSEAQLEIAFRALSQKAFSGQL